MDQIKIQYLGFIKEQFRWNISIGDESFEYFTGLGHCYHQRVRTLYDKSEFERKHNSKNCFIKDGFAFAINKPNQPEINDILYCLFSDAEAGEMSFNDFCDSFGYSNDSISALNIYQRCMKNTIKVRKLERLGLISKPEDAA